MFNHVQFTLIHGPNIPGSYAIFFFTALDFAFTTRHIHTWSSFLLWLNLFILSGGISLLFPSSILDTYQPGLLIFQCHICLPFHTLHGVLMTRILKWFTIPSLVNHNLSSPNCQRYFLQPLHVDGWHARHPGCPTAGPRWVCKPSPAAGCWSICNLWAKAEALHHIVGNTDFVISHFPFFILFLNQHIFQLSVMLHIHFITIVTLEIYQSRGFESYSSHNLLCF